MRGIKKDWLYNINSIFLILAGILCVAGVAAITLKAFVPAQVSEVIYELYKKYFLMLIFMSGLYPMWVLKGICPSMGSDKVYISTMNLPFSKKQLFLKGIKNFMIIIPIYFLIGAFFAAILSPSTESFILKYLFSMIEPLIGIIASTILFAQIYCGIILHLVRGIKPYKIIIGIILADILLGLLIGVISLGIGKAITDQFYFAFIVIGIFFFVSLFAFMLNWNDIEKVHR